MGQDDGTGWRVDGGQNWRAVIGREQFSAKKDLGQKLTFWCFSRTLTRSCSRRKKTVSKKYSKLTKTQLAKQIRRLFVLRYLLLTRLAFTGGCASLHKSLCVVIFQAAGFAQNQPSDIRSFISKARHGRSLDDPRKSIHLRQRPVNNHSICRSLASPRPAASLASSNPPSRHPLHNRQAVPLAKR